MTRYLGLKNGQRVVFVSDTIPTEAEYGKVFDAVVGPFKTHRGAAYMRDHGKNNPHCRSVHEAERLAHAHFRHEN